MKVIVEIQSKYVEIAKGIMLGACTDEESEKKVTEIAEHKAFNSRCPRTRN